MDYHKLHGRKMQKIIILMIMTGFLTCKKNTISSTGNNIVYHLALKENIESFDPVNSVDETSGIILNLLHRNLYTTSVDGKLVNDLAENVTFAGNSVYVSLKPGVYFNDSGKSELTAEDVSFSFLRLKSSQRQPWVLEKILDIQPEGRYVIRFVMKQPNETSWTNQKYLLSLPQCAIYSKNEFLKNKTFAGASSFTVTQYQPGSIELSSQGFKLEYRVISSDSSRWFYFQRNQLDIYEAEGVFQYSDNKKSTFSEVKVVQPIVLYGAIVANEGSVLENRELRRTLNLKFNRQDVAGKILMGSYQPADYPVPDLLGGAIAELFTYQEKTECKTGIQKATGGKSSSEVVHIYSPSDRDRQLVAMVIKKILLDCGIKSRIKVVDLSTLLKINNEKRTGIYLLKWIADYPHAENFILPLFHSRNGGPGGNRSYYKNERLDYILDNEGVTMQNIGAIEEMIRQDAPWIFVGFSKKNFYVNNEKKIRLPVMYTGWNEEVFNDR